MNIHEKYIKRCIQLAKNGLGTSYPNPLVGCVIVVDNEIIGEGWHYKAGMPHAEVNAIKSVKDVTLLSKATLYVSLEPCSHYGKTPPCSNLIVDKGIPNVVIGSIDFNSKVHGKGVEYLKSHGCNVTVGVLEKECIDLNKRFFTYHKKQRPYVILKWAQTSDNYIDKIREKNSLKKTNWISNEFSQQLSHKLRTTERAICVGTNTVLIDNPTLTARDWNGNNPIRIIIDKKARISVDSNCFSEDAKTIIITEKATSNYPVNCKVEEISFNNHKKVIQELLKIAFENEIQSIIVEGGAKTLKTFIEANLWDEALVFESKNKFHQGIKAPILEKKPQQEIKVFGDVLKCYKN